MGPGLAVVEHEQPERDADLWPGQAHAGRVVHRLDHVVARGAAARRRTPRRACAGVFSTGSPRMRIGMITSTAPVRFSQRCGSASTRVTTSRTASSRITRPNSGHAPGSSASKHTVCSPDDDDEQGDRVAAPRARARDSAAPATRKPRDPTGNPACSRASRLVGVEAVGVAADERLDAGSFGRSPARWRGRGAGPADRLHPRRERALPGRQARTPLSEVGIEDRDQVEAAAAPRSRTTSGPPTRISSAFGRRGTSRASRRGGPGRGRDAPRPLLHPFGASAPEPEVRRPAMRAPPWRLADDAPDGALLASRSSRRTRRTLPAPRTPGRPARSRTR